MKSTFKKPLISIVIPTYNAASTLERSLKSVVDQTFMNLEVLLIDNCSTDGTIEIANEYKHILPTLTVVSERDQGIYDAMNKGIALAKGQWLYFLGADDYLYNEAVFEQIAKEINNTNCEVIYGSVHSHFYNGIYDKEFSYEKITRLNICHQAIFLKKNIFNKIGEFDLKYQVAADWDHNLKWFFSDQIKNKYIDLIIAEFTDGGYSNLHEDLLFEQDKNLILIKKGLFKLPIRTLKKLCKTEKYKLSHKDTLGKKMIVTSYFLLMKVRLKIESIKKNVIFNKC